MVSEVDRNSVERACSSTFATERLVAQAAFAAATALVRIAKARGSLRGLTILELGAGTGLVSLVAHAWGAKAVATDNAEVSLRVLRASRAELSDAKRFVVCALDFSKEADVAAAVLSPRGSSSDESRRRRGARRGYFVWRRVAAAPRVPHG